MTVSFLKPLSQPRSIREAVTEQLRTAIIAGDLKEGELYSAPALAALLQVSATPVREAMIDLDREGLVCTEKNKGFRITGMTDKELEEVTEIRLLIEPYATRQAALHYQDADLSLLRELVSKILAAAEEENINAYLVADRDFHMALMAPCGNAQLVELATRMRLKTRQYGLKGLMAEKRLVENAQEHVQMVDLMAKGDARSLELLLASHISHARGLWNVKSE